MMEKAPMKYLVYREFLLSKRGLLIAACGTALYTLAAILCLLSLEVGNLQAIKANPEYATFIPLFTLSPAMFFWMWADSAIQDVKELDGKWERFRLSTPVSPMRFAQAKFLMILCLSGVSLFLSALYLGVLRLLGNEHVTWKNIKLLLFLICILLIYSVVVQVGVVYFRNSEKVLMIWMVVILTVMTIFMVKNMKMLMNAESPEQIMKLLSEKCSSFTEYLPVLALVTVAVFFGGMYLTGLLYKRRER